jgi:serine phosphatase RsbU (regulator of sigma subunit)
MRLVCSILFIHILSLHGYSSEVNLDSLNGEAENLIDNEQWFDAQQLLNQIELISLQQKDSFNLAYSFQNVGVLNYYQSNFEEAKINFKKAFDYRVLIDDTLGQANSLNNLAIVNMEQGDYSISIDHFFETLAIYESLIDSSGISRAYTNIGNVFYYQKQYDKSLSYYQKSLIIDTALKDDYGVAEDFQNIGLIFSEKAKEEHSKIMFDSSIVMFDKAIELYSIEEEALYEIGEVLSTKGVLYTDFGEYEKARECYEFCLETSKNSGNQMGYSESLLNIGDLYTVNKEYKKSIIYFEQARSIAISIGMTDLIKESFLGLADAHFKIGEKDLAYEEILRYIEIRDSLYSKANTQLGEELYAKYQTNKQLLEIKNLEDNKMAQNMINKKQSIIIGSFALGLVLTIVLIIVVLRNLKKQKLSRAVIEIQKHELQEKNEEISDSINYAKRIQEAILPDKPITDLFKDSSILYKPKDVVSGDFYWLEKRSNLHFFAVADCTGHGVPGGFMSMIGIILLNEIFNSEKFKKPAEILDELNRLLIISLQKRGVTLVQDGMDISFACYDGDSKELSWAGANNPLWILRDKNKANQFSTTIKFDTEKSDYVLNEIKGDKQPIGFYDGNTKVFTNHTLQLEEGDIIYLFSDGYPDQFGGPNGKKFKYKKLKELIIESSNQKIINQFSVLDTTFESWKGELEQIDDVCLLGVRI